MSELPLTVCCKQQHLGLGRLGQFLQLSFVIGYQLCVFASLVLQSTQTDLRDCPEFSSLRKSATLLQQGSSPICHGLITFAFVSLNKFEGDHPTTHGGLCF